MSKHTPAPWEAMKLDSDRHKPDTYMLGRSLPHHWTGIGTFTGCGEPGSPEDTANARLIAAAPELMAACLYVDRILKQRNLDGWEQSMRDIVGHALASARGETPTPAPEPRKGEYLIPTGARAGSCRSCGADVLWITTAKGSAMPLSSATIEERDGERYALSHFGDCPQAKGWSKKSR